MGASESTRAYANYPGEAWSSKVRRWALVLSVTCTSLAPLAGLADGPQPTVRYKPNTLPTTVFGPPAADVLVHPASNFLECSGGPIALCYYSGPPPEGDEPDLSCEVTDNPNFSNCRCIEIEHGPYFVDINAILDTKVYLQTVKKCGRGGADCKGHPNMAPVCQAINQNTLLPRAKPKPEVISTFSHALNSIPEYKIGTTNCIGDDIASYSGCMTAPCVRTDDTIELCQQVGGVVVCNEVPIDECTCPNWTGPFQIGASGADCPLPEGYTWSAAYSPTEALISKVKTAVQAVGCIPDAPGDVGCPLLPPNPNKYPLEPVTPPPPSDISCGRVCAEYRRIKNGDGVEVGFTCDATICTTPPTGSLADPFLIKDACAGLGSGHKGSLSEILKLELEVGCSCCASQICGCDASLATDEEIAKLNEAQRELGIEPQCDYNGSLCGKP